MAPGRPVPRRLGHHGRRRALAAGHVLHRHRGRRRVEDHRRGPHLAPADGPRARRRDRRNRRGAVEPQRDLRRHRPGGRTLRRRRGQRRVPLGRRRQDLAAPGPGRQQAHRQDPGRSAASGHRAGRRARPLLRAEPRARRVPLHRRRQDLEADAARGRRHRRGGHGRRSRQPAGGLRGDLAGAQLAVAVVLPAQRGAGQRPVQVHRRRCELEAPGRSRLAQRRPRAHRHRHHARQPRLCRGERRRASGAERPLPLRRRRRDVAGAEPRRLAAERLLQPHHRRSHRSGPRVLGRPVDPPLRRRRQELARLQGRARRRRLPLPVDRPDEHAAHDHRQRPGRGGHRQRRQELEQLVQPAHRTTSSRTGSTPASRTPAPSASPAAATTARSPSATGTPSAATSATTTCPTPATRASCSAPASAAACRAGTAAPAWCRTSRRGR